MEENKEEQQPDLVVFFVKEDREFLHEKDPKAVPTIGKCGSETKGDQGSRSEEENDRLDTKST